MCPSRMLGRFASRGGVARLLLEVGCFLGGLSVVDDRDAGMHTNPGPSERPPGAHVGSWRVARRSKTAGRGVRIQPSTLEG